MTSDADIERRFWAGFLGSKVEKDGQVPGFDQWWKKAHPTLAKIGLRTGRAVADHVRRGAPLEESIALAVSEFRQSIQHFRDNETPSTPRWTTFCSEIFNGVYEHGWKPPQVLQALEAARVAMAKEGPIEPWIAEVSEYGDEWPIERQQGYWITSDGRRIESRFA